MAENTVSFPDLALDKFSGNDPDQDSKKLLLTIENKINSSLGSRPTDNAKRTRYCLLVQKKALFSSHFRGPAAVRYGESMNDAATWDQIRTAFSDRLPDDRNKYRHRITAENCVRANEELIKNFYHRVKSAVDKGWPLDPIGSRPKEITNKTRQMPNISNLQSEDLKQTYWKEKLMNSW